MNIVKRELKAGLKPFLFWTLGLFVLVFAGTVKYTGLEAGGEAIEEMIAAFPRPLQAMLGMVGIHMTSLQGYYGVIMYFAMICIAIYAVSLGVSAVGRELTDKTYEFLFTKPCSRSKIMTMKWGAGLLYLIGFCALNYLFSVMAVGMLHTSENIDREILLFSVSIFLVGLLFYSLSTLLMAGVKKTEKGALYGNLCFIIMFILGMLYDMFEHGEIIRIFTPLRYFTAAEILGNKLNIGYLIWTLVLVVIGMGAAYRLFAKKDLTAGHSECQ